MTEIASCVISELPINISGSQVVTVVFMESNYFGSIQTLELELISRASSVCELCSTGSVQSRPCVSCVVQVVCSHVRV